MTATVVDVGGAARPRLRAVRALRVVVLLLVGLSVSLWLMQTGIDAEWATTVSSLDRAAAEVGWPYPAGSEAARLANEVNLLSWSQFVAFWSQVMVFSVASLVLLAWVYSAWRTLLGFGLADLGSSPARAVGVWFVPGANLVWIPTVMNRLLSGSIAAAEGRTTRSEGARSRLVAAWWTTYLLGVALYLVGSFTTDWLVVVGDGAFAVSGVLLMVIVGRVVGAQRRAAEAWAGAGAPT